MGNFQPYFDGYLSGVFVEGDRLKGLGRDALAEDWRPIELDLERSVDGPRATTIHEFHMAPSGEYVLVVNDYELRRATDPVSWPRSPPRTEVRAADRCAGAPACHRRGSPQGSHAARGLRTRWP